LGNVEGRGLVEKKIIGEEMNTELETPKEASTLQYHTFFDNSVKLFQTCMNFLLNNKEYILKNVGNQTVDGPH